MCRCTEGILQLRLKSGRFVQVRYQHDPFAGRVRFEGETEDERDWNNYIQLEREWRDDEHFDPVRYLDGTSTYDAARRARVG
jgi:hypothetical protein